MICVSCIVNSSDIMGATVCKEVFVIAFLISTVITADKVIRVGCRNTDYCTFCQRLVGRTVLTAGIMNISVFIGNVKIAYFIVCNLHITTDKNLAVVGNINPAAVILCGVAITAVLNAGISFLAYLNPDVLADYNFFSVGGVGGTQAKELILPAVAVAFCTLVTLVLSNKIDILCLGDSIANSLGVRVKLLRVSCLAVAGLSAAAAVSFAGLLGFVGLVVPHVAVKITDGSVGEMLKISVLTGGILVVTADLIGRILFAPSELPVGVVMAFVGAPFLLYIVIRRSKNA